MFQSCLQPQASLKADKVMVLGTAHHSDQICLSIGITQVSLTARWVCCADTLTAEQRMG